MMAESGHRHTVRATLCEIERGLFYVTYEIREHAALGLPVYQLGKSAADAKDRIEQSGKSLGYDTIIWEDALVVLPPQERSVRNGGIAEQISS